jgi:hypothetical protein
MKKVFYIFFLLINIFNQLISKKKISPQSSSINKNPHIDLYNLNINNEPIDFFDSLKKQKQLIDNLKFFVPGLNDEFSHKWKEKKYIQSIDYLMEKNQKFLTLEEFNLLYIKALRLNPQILQVKNDKSKSQLDLLQILNNISINSTFNINNHQNKKEYTHSINGSINIGGIKDIFIMPFFSYIKFYQNSIKEWEIQFKIFNQLINNITDYLNNQLIIIKYFIKILYFQDQLEFLIESKENFNDEQVLHQIQKLHKYLNKFFEILENLSKNENIIKNLTAVENIPYLMWSFHNVNYLTELNKEIENFKKISLKKYKHYSYFKQQTKLFINESLEKSTLFKYFHKLLGFLKFNNSDFNSLLKNKKIIEYIDGILKLINVNYTKSFTTNFDEIQLTNFNKNQYSSNNILSFEISINNILKILLDNIQQEYQLENDIVSLKEKAINFYHQSLQLLNNYENNINKEIFLRNKINLYKNKLINQEDKDNYLIKKQEFQYTKIKNQLFTKINFYIEQNNKIKSQLLLLYNFNLLKIKK